VESSKGNTYLFGCKPDISVYPASVSLGRASVDRIGEIKKAKAKTKDFEGAHKGQTVHYAMLILRAQRYRDEVTVFLTDCHMVTFFSVRWEARFIIRESLQYDLTGADSLGRRLLSAVLASRHPTIPFSPFSGNVLGKEIIQCTASSTLFKSSLADAVLKLCIDPKLITAEVSALTTLKSKLGEGVMNSLGIIRLALHTRQALLLKPLAQGPASILVKSRKLPLSCLAPVVASLKAVHTAGVFHRDARASNILLLDNDDGTVKPILADFGCGCSVDEAMPLTEYGAPASYWSRHASEGHPFRPQEDLHIFVRALYSINNTLPNASDVTACLQFWEQVGMSR
jgi:hypothetical protein